jgi:hypothetical protein
MLETIRQFAEEQLVARGADDEVRAAHARYFAEREADILALWDGPRQREAYDWFTTELANLRTAFRWAADHDDLDAAAAIAVYATLLGTWLQQNEPASWAEELIERARSVDHRRLAQLYVMASQCYAVGRVDDALGYTDVARLAIESGRFDEVPFEFEAALGGPYIATGQTERWVEWCRSIIARGPGRHTYARSGLVMALATTGCDREAIAAAETLRTADTTDNPGMTAYPLFAYGFANLDADPSRAYEALRKGFTIARETGNRLFESLLASSLSRLAATCGVPVDALEYLNLAVRFFYDSGSLSFTPRSRSSRNTSTGSDTTRLRQPSAASPRTRSRTRQASTQTRQSPTCEKFSAMRATNRSPAHAKT